MHAFFVLAGLVFVDFLLLLFDVAAPLGEMSYMIYLMAALAVAGIELAVRGLRPLNEMHIFMSGIWLLLSAANVVVGILNQRIETVVFYALALLAWLAIFIRAIYDLRKRKRGKKEAAEPPSDT